MMTRTGRFCDLARRFESLDDAPEMMLIVLAMLSEGGKTEHSLSDNASCYNSP